MTNAHVNAHFDTVADLDRVAGGIGRHNILPGGCTNPLPYQPRRNPWCGTRPPTDWYAWLRQLRWGWRR